MKMYCTLDTETVGGCTKPEGFYHIGGFVHDRAGRIYGAFNLVVADMFEKIRYDDYAKKNFSLYEQMVQSGAATMVSSEDSAISTINSLLDFYGVNTMMAFNSGFDFNKTKAGKLCEGRDFIDLYLMAIQTIGQYKKYANFCRENNLCSRNGKNISGTVESFTAFLTGNPDYCEEHTALEDARVEMNIFKACIATHRKFNKNMTFYDHPQKWSYLVPMKAGK